MPASPSPFNDHCEPEVAGAQGGAPPHLSRQALSLAWQLQQSLSTSVNNSFPPSSEYIPEEMLNPFATKYVPDDGDKGKSQTKSNTTECVPVPSSEHVAEIVGRQGKKLSIKIFPIDLAAKSK